MSTGRTIGSPPEMGDQDLPAPLDALVVAGSPAKNWLAHMILAVKTIAAGAEFIPLPYIRATFGTVIILLETVDKMKKNRDDLQDLCASTVEIVLILRNEIAVHGHAAGLQFMGLCENFIAFLRLLQTGLEKLMRSGSGVRGRFKEFLRTTSVADQIERYRTRINELRSNFVLVATIDTNFNVASIQKSVATLQETCPIAHQPEFRRIALGDINLLYETAMSSKVYKVKVFTARISGEPSSMTVVKYEDENEKWKQDLELYSPVRHPHVWQLFGFTAAPGLHALIYYDELIPLTIYHQFHRPSSDLVWACIEGMLFKQFKECSPYHYWCSGDQEKEVEATICVKREPVRLCLTMPGFRDEYDPDDLEHNLSSWHTDLFQHQNAADTDTLRFSVILTTHPHTIIIPEVLAQHLDWWDLFRALVPVQLQTPTPCGLQTRLFLGSAVNGRGDFGPIAYIPNSFQVRMKKWGLKPLLCVHSDGGEDSALNRFTFLPGSFKTLEIPEFPRILLSSSIGFADEDVNVFNASWLSQANMCIGKSILPNRCKRYRYGVVEMLSCVLVMDAKFQHVIRSEGTLAQAHIFLCPISVRHEGLRIGLEFPESDYFYWSLDSAGNSRMTLAECDYIGLPRLEFMFLPTAKFWHEYHYNAVREFSEARGFNPHSSEVARLLGLPLVEIESEIRPTESNAALG